MSTAPDDGLSGAWLQITGLAERIALLENRVVENLRHADVTLANMSGAIATLKTAVDGQAEMLKSLDGLGEAVAMLTAQVSSLLPPPDEDPARGYTPRPSVHWWRISTAEHDRAVEHLRAWVEQVYRPHYGHLAAKLGPCWEEHPLCLAGLDVLSETHSVLYFQPKRSAALLTAQAEFGIRIVPAFADQFGRETSSCKRHRAPAANGSSPWAGAR